MNKLEYVVEVFINYNEREHFFNKVYLEDISYNYIWMNDKYAYLSGHETSQIL